MDGGEKLAIFERMEEIDGWMTQPQAMVLMDLADKYIHKNSLVVELGVWKGKSLYLWGTYAKKHGATVCGVDTFNGIPDINDKNNEMFYKESLKDPDWFMNTFAKEAIKDLPVALIKKTTIEASSDFKDKSIDLCFIDADHSYQGVYQDIKHWLPKMKDMGIICGHDFDQESVSQAVKELLPDYKVNHNIWLKLV